MLVTVAERVIYGLWVPPSVAALPSDVAPQRPGGGVASVATVETPRSAVVRELSGSTAAAQGGGSAAPSAAQDGGAEASPAVAGCLAVGASSEVARVRPLYLRADAHLGSERTVLATPVLGTPLDELQSRVVPGRRPQLAPALKLALHISLVIALHASFCIGLARGGASALPVWACNKDYCDGTEAPAGQPICTRSRAGLGFYLLCCLYLLLSALQLKHGMPLIPTEHPLTGSAGLSRYYLHLAAMSFPFLWEMRTSLDWTVARTSLSLFEWLKLEDIYAGLVSVRATMAFKLRSPRGAQRTVETKLGTGALFVAAVLLLILGPMFVFSSANPISEANLVRSAQVRLTLRTPTGLFPLGATTRFNNDIELPLPLTSPVLSADCSGDKLQEETSDRGRGCASRRTQRGSRPSTGQEVGEGLRVCVPAAARRQRRLPARLVRRGERPCLGHQPHRARRAQSRRRVELRRGEPGGSRRVDAPLARRRHHQRLSLALRGAQQQAAPRDGGGPQRVRAWRPRPRGRRRDPSWRPLPKVRAAAGGGGTASARDRRLGADGVAHDAAAVRRPPLDQQQRVQGLAAVVGAAAGQGRRVALRSAQGARAAGHRRRRPARGRHGRLALLRRRRGRLLLRRRLWHRATRPLGARRHALPARVRRDAAHARRL
uniref:Piezo THU9 and anchor domain-containing protein n=2 Tax=Emiliania huxleyi TaxID=2903 RepID=A0A7S3WEL8_EMIHU